ncbi:MAG: hypothetical protein LBK03_05400 [Bacteroidales bacterium]|jgi:hypothetical protein|nr:hypothetical protein [Bacteroidales bacterium]
MMKNKTKVLPFLLLISIVTNSALAQKNSWTIGCGFGLVGTVFQKGYVFDSYRNTLSKEWPFSFELTTTYGITNYLSISTGIAWVYKDAVCKRVSVGKREQLYFKVTDFDSYNTKRLCAIYHSVEIPIKLNFSIPLGKSQFYFTGNAGLIFDVIISYPEDWLQQDRWYETLGYASNNYVLNTEINQSSNLKKVNFLINAGIGFGYHFKCGVGLWLTGDYNAGTRIMSDIAIKNS